MNSTEESLFIVREFDRVENQIADLNVMTRDELFAVKKRLKHLEDHTNDKWFYVAMLAIVAMAFISIALKAIF